MVYILYFYCLLLVYLKNKIKKILSIYYYTLIDNCIIKLAKQD